MAYTDYPNYVKLNTSEKLLYNYLIMIASVKGSATYYDGISIAEKFIPKKLFTIGDIEKIFNMAVNDDCFVRIATREKIKITNENGVFVEIVNEKFYPLSNATIFAYRVITDAYVQHT